MPSPLTVVRASPTDHSVFALAGKEIEVSLWDLERTFADGAGDGCKVGEKRKKDEKEVGEIWRAKNVGCNVSYTNKQLPNNHLSLRRPVHHLALCFLPVATGERHHLIATGTKAGTVRRYDTRQRKPCDDWKVAKEGGVGCIEAGRDDQYVCACLALTVANCSLPTGLQC